MKQTARIVYAGTPEFAVAPLEVLLAAGYSVVGVFTQPDRPAGRGREPRPSPVKQAALRHGLEVFQPERLATPEQQQLLAGLDADLMIVTAYGLILPQAVLDMPRLGCVNIHASLLPRWRGAAPIQRAIIAGDDKTGITLMQMDAGLDTGAMLAQRECAIHDDDTGASLHDRLMRLGADTLLHSLPELLAGRLTPRPQDEAQASYAHKLSKQEAELDWRQSAAQLQRCVRAFDPWPVAYTGYRKKGRSQLLRVWQAEALDARHDAAPGTVIASGKHGIDVACGDGVLRLQQVQGAGKRRMDAAEFANAHDLDGQVLACASDA